MLKNCLEDLESENLVVCADVTSGLLSSLNPFCFVLYLIRVHRWEVDCVLPLVNFK